MASPKVISTTNQDMPRQSSTMCSSPLSTLLTDLQSDPSKTLGSMSMDDLLKCLYSDQPAAEYQIGGASLSRDGSFVTLPKDVGGKSVDEVWKEIVAGTDQRRGGGEEITLEDFLTKAGAVREEEVRGAPEVVAGAGGYGVEAAAAAAAAIEGQFQMQNQGVEGAMVVLGKGREWRGKRRTVQEPVDKATQQKQRRMIKNRESAARSRERKQAYTFELETLVTQLEEENARLLREEAEYNSNRLKELMESLVPVEEKQRPARVLRRVHSMLW